jgi:hypothetical protein
MTDFTIFSKEYELYADKVFANAKKMIKHNVWAGVPETNINAWEVYKERSLEDYFLLALAVDALTYRSQDQFLALMEATLTSKLELSFQKSDTTFLDSVVRGGINSHDVQLIPVIKPKDPPTKSGPLVLRHICKSLGIQERGNTAWPKFVSLGRPASIYLYVDDFSGTGKQFTNFIKDNDIDVKCGTHVYLCGAIHDASIEKIGREYPEIKIIFGEKLNEKNSFFYKASRKFDVSEDMVKEYYIDFITRNKFSIIGSDKQFGYKDQALTYATYISTPNNSLPLYWFENEYFKPLIGR